MKRLSLFFVALLFSAQGSAAGNPVYFGGGMSFNSLSGVDFSDGLGFQLLGGYKLPVNVGKGSLSVEVGYMDTGDMEAGVRVVSLIPFQVAVVEANATGVWANAVFSMPVQKSLNVIGRAGFDFGDDDGFMFGAGMGFNISPTMEVRGEYVLRDNVDSLQANLIVRM